VLTPSLIVHAGSGNFTSTYRIEVLGGNHGFLDTRTMGMVHSGASTFTVTLTPNRSQTLSVTGVLQRNNLFGWSHVTSTQIFDRDTASTRTFTHNNSGNYRIRLSVSGTRGQVASGSIRVNWTDR